MAYSGAFQKRDPQETGLPPDRAAEPPRGSRAERPAGGPKPSFPFDLGAILQKTEAAGLETDDLLMALILYLMYRESGDVDLLIMLGVMLLT